MTPSSSPPARNFPKFFHNTLSTPIHLLLFVNSTCMGFNKVNDTFHGTNSANASGEGSGSSGAATSNATSQREFKHGAGSFKRGDVEALRAIKRRASRPSAVHRDNISLKPVSLSVPSTPPADYGTPPPTAGPSIGLQQPIPGHPHPQSYLPQHHTVPYYPPPDNNVDARLAALENSLWALKSSHHTLVSKYNNLVDNCKRMQLESLQLVRHACQELFRHSKGQKRNFE